MRRTRPRRVFGLTLADFMASGAVIFAGAIGAALFYLLTISSDGGPAVAEVQATAVVSTGLVQGSEGTLATYEINGKTRHVLVSGDPRFAGDIFPVSVNEEGQVVYPIAGILVVFVAGVGFILFAMFALIGILVGDLAFNRF
jgi:hypothetical protein